MKGVEQNPTFHPEGDVFVHTMLMMQQLCSERILRHSGFGGQGSAFPTLVLSLACLFHDIGKPKTFEPETLRTPAHEHIGARMTEKIMRRLKFSNAIIEQVVWCVKNHMMFMHVQKMRLGKLKRLMGLDTYPIELELHRIDCLACHGMLDNYEFLLKKREEFAEEDLKPKPFINGHDLIALGMKPGPNFRDILDEAWTLQLEHVFQTRAEAIVWLRNTYKNGDRE